MSPREIDALVAEHCMGFTGIQNGPEGLEMILERCCMSDLVRFGPVPSYSTDPAASKQLRDKMRADGWAWSLECVVADDCIRACFFRAEEDGEFVYADSDTEEMAVALAALSAVGKPVAL